MHVATAKLPLARFFRPLVGTKRRPLHLVPEIETTRHGESVRLSVQSKKSGKKTAVSEKRKKLKVGVLPNGNSPGPTARGGTALWSISGTPADFGNSPDQTPRCLRHPSTQAARLVWYKVWNRLAGVSENIAISIAYICSLAEGKLPALKHSDQF